MPAARLRAHARPAVAGPLATLGAMLACVVAGLFVPAPPAHSAIVQRCTASDGSALYTDGACAAFGAQPAPMRAELINRLASEARAEGREDVDLAALTGVAPALEARPRRAAADGCARDPRQLARDLRASIALGDVNRLAESYHWAGMSTRAGQRTLDRLARLIGRQAVASRYFAAQFAGLDAGGWREPTRGGDAGILQLVLAGQGMQQAIEFDVHRYQGCYFVSF